MGMTFDDLLYQCTYKARMIKKVRKEITDDELEKIVIDKINEYKDLMSNSIIDEKKLLKQLQKHFITYERNDSSILSDEYFPWLKHKEVEIKWKFWNRYKEYLSEKNWTDDAIDDIDLDTFKILDRLWDPSKNSESDQWDRRGMVVGNVQSGKTANFTGLICKATDAGFKVIIILAGMHDSLRIQTQKRLDEEFLGYKSDSSEESKKIIGVGNISLDIDWVDTITTQSNSGDFGKRVSDNFNRHMSSNPILLVVKKNVYVLKNIIKWLTNTAQLVNSNGKRYHSGYPLLLIDDEADNASVDTSEMSFNEDGTPDKNHDPKAINKSIRKILKIFNQSAYVAYTATPQANIYIHDKAKTINEGPDLYPRHFIINLEASSEYFGPRTIFGDENQEGLDLVRVNKTRDYKDWIPDGHKSYHKIDLEKEIPNSLKNAIHSFILATSARIERGQINKHNSMLIHVTRYKDIQGKVKEQVNTYVKKYLLENINNENSPSKISIINTLKELWEKDFYETSKKINDPECEILSWDQIKQNLYSVIRLIEIKEINGTAKDVLDYDNNKEKGLITIAIGGDKLSRGLTLEGLTISYYLRSTKMYDTLMQMGRWFGYRPGYYDLCRLYTSPELHENYIHITKADLEMREQFKYMEIIGSTPGEFGLKVRSHESLLVTSKVKMRNSEKIRISFAASRKESLMYYRNKNIIVHNFIRFKSFINEIWERKKDKVDLIFSYIEADKIVDFLDSYMLPNDTSFPKERIINYIKKQRLNNYLVDWTVYISKGRIEKDEYMYTLENGKSLPMTVRTVSKKAEDSGRNDKEHFFPGITASRGDDTKDLLEDEKEIALKNTIKEWEKKKGKKSEEAPKLPSDLAARYERDPRRGLLMIYPIYPQSFEKEALLTDLPNTPMIGIAISFPENTKDEKIEYIVDNKYYDQELGYE
ncbi:Z1 domain-containing protein [Aliarcobacter butzleri]|uniref:Z1 domain-containing protein n=1 Tax=Aliarcobacter butzleri TaxID=28197 RepID=UPI00191AA132|nr:Z1 domain-containing protein [Aliarcobacter butzleri]